MLLLDKLFKTFRSVWQQMVLIRKNNKSRKKQYVDLFLFVTGKSKHVKCAAEAAALLSLSGCASHGAAEWPSC